MDPALADGRKPAEAGNALHALGEQLGEIKATHLRVTRRKLALLAAEARLAVNSLVLMIVAGLLALLVVTAAWTMVCLAAGWLLTGLGWALPWVYLTVGGINLLLAVLLVLGIRRLGRNLTFEASRRNLL